MPLHTDGRNPAQSILLIWSQELHTWRYDLVTHHVHNDAHGASITHPVHTDGKAHKEQSVEEGAKRLLKDEKNLVEGIKSG